MLVGLWSQVGSFLAPPVRPRIPPGLLLLPTVAQHLRVGCGRGEWVGFERFLQRWCRVGVGERHLWTLECDAVPALSITVPPNGTLPHVLASTCAGSSGDGKPYGQGNAEQGMSTVYNRGPGFVVQNPD